MSLRGLPTARLLARAALLLTLVGMTSAAAKEAVPPLAEPRPFVLPSRSNLTLDNGLTVTFLDVGEIPKATVIVFLRTGSIDEGSHNGLADFVGEYLREGAGERDATAVAAAAADMGGTLSIGMGAEQSTFALDVLSERVPDAVALLGDVLRRPALPDAALSRLRADALRQLAVSRTQPQQLAGDALRRALYGTHRYGRGLPSDADVNGYTVGDVRDFVARNFGAARTRVYIAGHFDHARAERAVRDAFGSWAPGPAPTVDIPVLAPKRRVVLIDRPGAPQSTVLIGAPGADPTRPDYTALAQAVSVLGGGLQSRFNQDLREQKGWTYGVQGWLAPTYRSGTVTFSADVITAHTAESVAALLRGIAALRQTPPPADELRRTQNYRAGSYVIGVAGRSGLAGVMGFLDLHELPDSWLSGYMTRVYGVTPADVSAALSRYVQDAALTVVVLGDRRAFEKDLRALPELDPATTVWTDATAPASHR